ncbi:MAG: DUF192 domain-containing protein [Desulfarculaceae bacterium]|nr:DUF192 domain-containing protein [Desulfarculaceae bacterium]
MLISRRISCFALALALLSGLALGASSGAWAKPLPLAKVELGNQVVLAEVPATALQRYHGLGGRRALAPGMGMLFFFYKGGPRTMCMRAMNFGLDFIWLAGGKVSEISHRVPPAGEGLSIDPVGHADLVLEVPAGWAKENKVRPGDAVTITPLGRDFPAQLKKRLIMESDAPRR